MSKSDASANGRQSASGFDALRGGQLTATLLTILGLAVAFVILGWHMVVQQGAIQAEIAAKAQHDAYVSYFNSRLLHLRRDVERAADSALARNGLIESAEADRATAGDELREVIAYSKRVDLVPRGRAEVDLSADVPITFTSLDVIKRAATNRFVGPESSINPPGYIYAAAPITREGVVAGVLFVAFSSNYLLEPLRASFNEDAGQVRIQQSFDGMVPVPIMQWGQATDDSSREISTDLENSHLRMTFTPAQALNEAGNWAEFLLPVVLASVLSLGGIFLAFSRLRKNLRHDSEQLGENIARLQRGRSARRADYKLGLLRPLDELLNPRQRDTAESNADTAAPPAPAAPATKAKMGGKRKMKVPADDVDDLLADLNESSDEDDFLDVADTNASSKSASDQNFGIGVEETDDATPQDMGLKLDPEIFRAYDIRGITTTNLTAKVVYWVGRAFAAEARHHNQARVAVGRDGRNSSPELAAALAKGLTEGGMDVLDVGQVPTPVLYFATHFLKTGTGIMVTGSHNPPEYNGLKMVMAEETLAEDRIQRLLQRLENNELSEGAGTIEAVDLSNNYMDRILDDVAIAQPKKVVVDCGNGVAGAWAPRLLEELGCTVIPLYCEVDGNFPNHHPDPAEPKNLEDLITVVDAEGADLGLAFDGDGDRLGIVTPKGKIVWPDQMIMLFSQDIISRNPGADIIYDVKCSRHLNHVISESGGRPIMWKTGHSHIKAKMKATGALLGGEFSGHICFGERWYGFDDAIYSAARLLEIVGSDARDIDEIFDQYPDTFATPELKIQTTDREKFVIMDKLIKQSEFGQGTITSIDGLRVDFDDSWGLIRPSNTSPVLSLRFEADSPEALAAVQEVFAKQLQGIDPDLKF